MKMGTPEYRQQCADRAREIWARPGMRDRMSEIQLKLWSDPHFRQKMIAKKKEMWSDPVLKKRMLEGWYKANERMSIQEYRDIRFEQNPTKKPQLTDDEVREIRELHARQGSKYSYAEIGRMFGVGNGVIHALLKGRTYKHVRDES